MTPATLQRKRVNLMIDIENLEKLEEMIPSGNRSDFVNEAIEEKFRRWGRRKALELMNLSIKNEKHIHTTKEILKTLHADRKY